MPPEEWEFWLDNQISPVIAKWMNEATGFTFKSSYILNFKTTSDHEIFQTAKKQGNVVIVTKDGDFTNFVNTFGPQPKLLCIRIENCDNKVLFNFILSRFNRAVQLLTKPYIHIVDMEF